MSFRVIPPACVCQVIVWVNKNPGSCYLSSLTSIMATREEKKSRTEKWMQSVALSVPSL